MKKVPKLPEPQVRMHDSILIYDIMNGLEIKRVEFLFKLLESKADLDSVMRLLSLIVRLCISFETPKEMSSCSVAVWKTSSLSQLISHLEHHINLYPTSLPCQLYCSVRSASKCCKLMANSHFQK